MEPAVPLLVWFVILGATTALILSLALARRRARPSKRAALLTAAGLAAWLAAVVAVAAAGLLRGVDSSPPRIGLAVVLPVALGVLALTFSGRARAFVTRIPQPSLVGVQSLRVVGVVFLVLEARGVLPAHFARPAGLGDIAVGLAAAWVARALARGAPGARALAIAWNLLGILDLMVAVGVGVLTARSPIQVFFSTPSMDAMAVLPLALIPAFDVPIFLLLHIASLTGLRRDVVDRKALLQRRAAVTS